MWILFGMDVSLESHFTFCAMYGLKIFHSGLHTVDGHKPSPQAKIFLFRLWEFFQVDLKRACASRGGFLGCETIIARLPRRNKAFVCASQTN
jgi:hypothetical protein